MSDEQPRFTHGNPLDQGRESGVPAWWGDLERTDLPDDPRTAPGMPAAPPAPARLHLVPPRSSRRLSVLDGTRAGNALLLCAVATAAVVVAWLGLGAGSVRGLVVVALIFGVPVGLTMIAVTAVTRHSR